MRARMYRAPSRRYARGVRRPTSRFALPLACLLICAASRPGLAEQPDPAPEPGQEPARSPDPAPDDELDPGVDFALHGAITAGLLAGTLLVTLVPVDRGELWERHIFGPLDRRVENDFSASAAQWSDGLLALTLVSPVLLELPRGLRRDTGQRLLMYSEAVSASLLLNNLAKYLVQRPRPYNYHPDPRVQGYADASGDDAHLSFYSGHASSAFAAAVAGSYLFSLGPAGEDAKAVVWLIQTTLATATAGLRVRAGKHFYSDVVIGAVAGSGMGLLVPALHAGEGGLRMPSGLEWGAMAGGVILGGLASWLLPLDHDVLTPLDAASALEIPTMAPASAPVLWYTGQF